MSNFGSREFYLEVSKGNIPKHSNIIKFGENPDIDSGAGFETIWDGGGVYVPPTEGRLHDIVSTSALDAGTILSSGTSTGGSQTTLIDTGATFVTDGVAVGDFLLNDTNFALGLVALVTETQITVFPEMRAGLSSRSADDNESGNSYRVVTDTFTGAALVAVAGLDPIPSYAAQEEFVVLNGLSNVATVGLYQRIYRMRSLAVASVSTVGTITATAQTDLTVSAQIINGNNQTLMTVFTIPLGSTGYLTQWWGSITKKQAAVSELILRAGRLNKMGYIMQNRSLLSTGSSEFSYEPKVPLRLPGGSDIWVEADSDTNNTSVSAGFDILLVED